MNDKLQAEIILEKLKYSKEIKEISILLLERTKKEDPDLIDCTIDEYIIIMDRIQPFIQLDWDLQMGIDNGNSLELQVQTIKEHIIK